MCGTNRLLVEAIACSSLMELAGVFFLSVICFRLAEDCIPLKKHHEQCNLRTHCAESQLPLR